MAAVRILIIEDDEEAAAELRQHLEAQHYEVTGIADNLRDALGLFYAQKPDMVIVDIFLNGQPEGITFAEKMNENHHTRKPFIFLTSATDRTTFEAARITAPFSYLLKPFNKLELQYAIELALEKFAHEVGVLSSGQSPFVLIHESFFIKKREVLVKVPIRSIAYIEVEGKYLNIYSDDHNFLVQISLVEMLNKLPGEQFIRVNRNTIVNIRKMVSIHLADDHIILESGKRIRISRRNRDNIIKIFDVLK